MAGRWVTWIEPFGPDNEPVHCMVPEETAIAVRKSINEKSGLEARKMSDEHALIDFMVVHFAEFCEPPPHIRKEKETL